MNSAEDAMSNSYETFTTVDQQSQIHIGGLPFAPGMEVEVVISPKRSSSQDFSAAWQRVCQELRERPGMSDLSNDEIQKEITDFRTGR
jgi:hypothetical protein